jgi:predicted nucleic acid-binding protein
MVLVDTSVWVAHLRHGGVGLDTLLTEGQVLCHPFIIGELACGNIRRRSEILTHLQALPQATLAKHEEVLQFIENHRLMGKGLGYVDMHLLASVILTRVSLWTMDKKLNDIAVKLRLGP